ncbi:MAG: VWA domain-containing protein [Actinobacteria bacterium]|nr:VWA domain-containing protein [Actinomycetota bacterium]
MNLVFLTPGGVLLTLGVLIPLVALFFVRRRAGRVRSALGLDEPRRLGLVFGILSLLAAGTFLGLAAAQPVIERTTTLETRTDAEAFIVLDVSRSMLARRSPRSATRIERAKTAARTLRAALPEVRFGIASLTDRALPHLFPSIDHDVFESTLTRSLGIEQPPPRSSLATNATSLDALATIRTQRYFMPKSRKRLLIVLTDGESQPVSAARLASVLRRPPVTDVVLVHVWHADERVYSGDAPEPQYRPDPSSSLVLDGLARAVSGDVYAESEIGAATTKARELIGSGPTVVRGERSGQVPLAPYLAAAALAPLALLLWRRDR